MVDFASLNKVAVAKAAMICRDIQLDEPALKCLDSDPVPADFLKALIEQEFYVDAVRFLARALPKREATWWACLCARSVLAKDARPEQIKAVETAEQWVYKPTELNRRSNDAAAQAATFDSPAAWAAMAAFWSGGSMAPEDAPAVPSAENLTAKAAAGAVMLAAVLNQPEKAQEKYRFFLEQGIDIANGGNGRLWQG